MKIIMILISIIAGICFSCRTSDRLVIENKLSSRIEAFAGDAGLYVYHFLRDESFEIKADTLFPSASMIKVPILVALFDRIEQDSLKYRADLTWYADSINYPYDGGILNSFEDGKKIPLSKVISLMITYSDNHASLWCQHLAGGGEWINDWLSKNGFTSTRVNSRTPGREKDWEVYGWGQTTPREMTELVTLIRYGRAVSPAASREMYRILSNIYWYGEALSVIPPQIRTISKQGAVRASRSEVVLVNAPSGDYVFCLITKNQKDVSWKYENEGFILLREISRILWNYFEPDFPFESVAGSELYR